MSLTTPVVRIVPLAGLPQATRALIRDGRLEAAKVWTTCRDLHLQARKEGSKWPGRDALQKAAKGRFALHSQSVQMVTHAFLANIDTTHQLRQLGHKEMRYPWRDKTFYPLHWPAQAMAIQNNNLILPMGRGRKSIVLDKPEWLAEPSACKLVWNGIHDELHVTVETPVEAQTPGTARAAIDLGQIHLATVVTDTGHALIISGRGIRSEKRQMNKMHGALAKRLSKCTKGSRKWKKLKRARNTQAHEIEVRVRDMRHKATRQAISFCVRHEVGSLYIGNPDGVRRNRCGRKHNQRMSQWEYGKDINYLQQKATRTAIASFTGTERGTSSRCPECGARHRPKGRNWNCSKCGFAGHRDIVGGVNMHEIGFGIKVKFPSLIDTTYQQPISSMKKRSGLNTRTVGSCSSPDTGHSSCYVAALEVLEPTPGFAGSRKRSGNSNTTPAEAHSL
jgi:putative transposase